MLTLKSSKKDISDDCNDDADIDGDGDADESPRRKTASMEGVPDENSRIGMVKGLHEREIIGKSRQ